MGLLETHKLVKKYGSFKAVDSLSLDIPPGSAFGFLGPNGAGKTTTIKMMAGLIKPSSGDIIYNKNQLKFGSGSNRKYIGYLPENPGFYGWMRPGEFLRFSGEMLGMDKRKIRSEADKLLEITGLSGVKKKISAFSRGMKQRLGIAQALLGNPELVLLDEPVSALDPIGRKAAMDIIAEMRGKFTILFSTHILNDIERACTHAAIINKGRLLAQGPIGSIIERYPQKRISIEAPKETIDILKSNIKAGLTEIKIAPGGDNILTIETESLDTARDMAVEIINRNKLPFTKIEAQKANLEEAFLKILDEDAERPVS